MVTRAPLFARTSRLTNLIALGALTFAGAFAATPARAAMYGFGIDDQQRIRQVDLSDIQYPKDTVLFEAASIVCSALGGDAYTACSTGFDKGTEKAMDYYSNSFAYDKVRNQFFFLDYLGNLRFWDFKPSTPVPILAEQANNGLAGSSPLTRYTANAAYYNNAYWYFIASHTTLPDNTGASPNRNKLVKYDLTYDSNGVPQYSSLNKATLYSIANLPSGIQIPTSPPANSFSFGDIAISESGTLYGTTVYGGFFKIDLTSCGVATPGSCNNADIALTNADNTNPSLQIFYDNYNGESLWGQRHVLPNTADSGSWGTFDPTTGIYTNRSINPTGVAQLRDIAGASQRSNAPVPGPLPLLGAGAAFGWTRRLRRRLKAA